MLEPRLPTLARLLLLETDTEANVVVAGAGAAVVAAGRTQARTSSVRGTAPSDTVGAFVWSTRIDNGATQISTMPIRRPFSCIAVHIKKAPRVGFV